MQVRRTEVLLFHRWLRLFEQNFCVDKWIALKTWFRAMYHMTQTKQML
jgi:hypothetical protein